MAVPKVKNPLEFRHRVGPVLYPPLRFFMIPHYHVFEKTTYRPIKRITTSKTSDEAREHILEWCKRKTNEASYVQVAGAVLFASVVSCLGWDNLTASHWLGPASFYVTILLSLASIFTAAQQTIVLPDKDAAKSYDLDQIEALRVSLLGPSRDDEEPALTTLFAWQCPIMLMGYSVVFFLVGLCTVVITPLSLRPEWGAAAKTLVLFLTVLVSIATSATITTHTVYKFRY